MKIRGLFLGKQVKLSMKAWGSEHGLSLAQVKKLIADEVISSAIRLGGNDRKLILKAEADQLYHDYKIKSAGFFTAEDQAKQAEPKEQKFKKDAPGSGYREGSMMVNDEHSGVYSKARAAKETMAAKTAQVKYELLTGNLVEVDEVKRAAKNIGSAIKGALTVLPNKLAPILAAENDVQKVRKYLDEEIRVALENLSRGDYEFLKDYEESADE